MNNFVFDGAAKKSGVTLVEVLIALTIASLVMLPLILLFGVGEKVTYKSINEVSACNLALQKIEELKSRPFADLRQLIELKASSPQDGPFAEVGLAVEGNEAWNSPGVKYSRYAYLAFYPNINPDTSQVDFELQKRRIRIRVVVKFVETAGGQGPLEKSFELAAVVSDETLGSGLNATFPASITGN